MKKVATLALVLALVLVMAAPAFASVNLGATTNTLTVKEALSLMENAGSSTVIIKNVSQLDKSVLSGVFAKNKAATLLFRQTSGTTVLSQVKVTNANLAAFPQNARIAATLAPKAQVSLFSKYFKNQFAIAFAPVIGTPYEFTFRPNLAKDAKIVVYSYNAKTNTYFLLAPTAYFMDVNGFIHITGDGGYYIVCNGALLRK